MNNLHWIDITTDNETWSSEVYVNLDVFEIYNFEYVYWTDETMSLYIIHSISISTN